MSSYKLKEIFYSLQGEGANSGRAALFCRFSGCNLWSGNEADRESSICKFCDTDFVGTNGTNGGEFETAKKLVMQLKALWPSDMKHVKPFVVITGGEPLLQLDQELVDELHDSNFEIALETNGTINPPKGIDFVCVSPKVGSKLKIQSGDEIKVVYPQTGLDLKQYEQMDFKHFYLQAKDGEDVQQNIKSAMNYCLKNPHWRLSLQMHKILSIR